MPSELLPVGAPSDWVSLGPASRLLGVDPDTLRRWADGGRIRAFATPGGHRRFSRADLDRVVAARQPAHHLLAKLGATPDRLSRAYARAYRTDGSPAGLDRFAADARAALRTEGRRLVAVLLAYLDAERPADRSRWEAEAMTLIGITATRLAEAGATTAEVVEIYLRARQPLLGELGALGRRRALESTRLAALFEQAVALLDRLLLHLIGTYSAALAAPTAAKET
jgi:excisionase family DNA binding protein